MRTCVFKCDAATKKEKNEMNLSRAASFLQKLSAGPRVANELNFYICSFVYLMMCLDILCCITYKFETRETLRIIAFCFFLCFV